MCVGVMVVRCVCVGDICECVCGGVMVVSGVWSWGWWLCVHACVCVFERERERERIVNFFVSLTVDCRKVFS